MSKKIVIPRILPSKIIGESSSAAISGAYELYCAHGALLDRPIMFLTENSGDDGMEGPSYE